MHVCCLVTHMNTESQTLNPCSVWLSVRLQQWPGVSYGVMLPFPRCCFVVLTLHYGKTFSFLRNRSFCPGWLSGRHHAKWIEVADFIEVWFKEGWGGVWRTRRGRKGRRGRYHKLFYSYPGLPMYAGLVNNASPQCIIRTTTLFFSLTHLQLTLVGFFLLLNGCASHLIDLWNQAPSEWPIVFCIPLSFFNIHVQM